MFPETLATAVSLLVYEKSPYESMEKTFARLEPSAMSLVPFADILLLPKNCPDEPKISFPIFSQCLGSV